MIFTTISFCSSQLKTDLSAIKPDNSGDVLIKNATKQIDLEQTTGLPYYNTTKVDLFKYNNINFTQNYPKAKTYYNSKIGFLVNNQWQNKILGYYITTKNFEETNLLMEALKKKYGEPKVINLATEDWPYSGYYWQGTEDGFDILLNLTKQEFTQDNKQIKGYETDLYLIKSGLHYGNMKDRGTILQSFITRNK